MARSSFNIKRCKHIDGVRAARKRRIRFENALCISLKARFTAFNLLLEISWKRGKNAAAGRR